MNNNDGDLLIWAIVLGVGFPLAVIVLGEIIYRVQKHSKSVAATLRVVRNLVLPAGVLMLFVKNVLKFDPQANFAKAIDTIFWVFVIHAALSLLNTLLFAEAEADTWRAKVPKLLIDLSRLFLISLGTAIVLATVWKADLAGVATALGISSIVIGLALQDTLGSIMSGIVLLFERPFKVGDWIRLGELVGQVMDMNWRSVRLQTLEKEMVIIPHKVISGEIIRNFSQPQKLHAERIKIGFSYDDPPNLAKKVLKSTADSTQGILLYPEAQIFTLSYDDFAITYEVKFFIDDYENLEDIRDRFMTRVWYAAQRNNLTIPFPIQTLYHFDGKDAKVDSRAKKFVENLQDSPIFVNFATDKENMEKLSQGVVLQHFGVGEKAIRQGEINKFLYIIIAGQGVINYVDEFGQEHLLASINRGDFFGEMALFSGEPSPVAVTVKEDLEVMMIGCDLVNQMIETKPSLALEIAKVVEIRRKAIQNLKHSQGSF